MNSPAPALRIQRYLTQKQGIALDECEDALAACPHTHAYAIADGATEAFGARRWARLLVRGWVCRPQAGTEGFLQLLGDLAQRATRHWAAKKLPWYADEKRLQGSYAAFVGVVFRQENGVLRWRALAVGDCCLFQLRGSELLTALPLSNPAQFGYRPQLVPSRPDAVAGCAAIAGEFEGTAAPGDRFLLLSDAAACWFLDNPGLREELAAHLMSGRSTELDRYIAAQRQSGRMRNDDVAALGIEVAP
jgi:hypothetical protein